MKFCVSELLATAPESTDAMPKLRNPGAVAKKCFLTLGHCDKGKATALNPKKPRDPGQYMYISTIFLAKHELILS